MSKKELIESLKQQGFSKSILEVFSKIKREKFIPDKLRTFAYNDEALPIGEGQTISQPYTIAVMLSMLDLSKKQKVLEIGSGSGYVLALISEITKSNVYGIEIIKELAIKSKENLKDYKNIEIYNRNGASGLKEHAPYDRILISAATKEVSKIILNQLKDNGIIVAPIGSNYSQDLVAIKRKKDKFTKIKRIPGFIFVPFMGE